MFGDDIIFSPIVEEKQRAKTVYLPKGEWILTKDKKVYKEGMHYIKADINEYIAFVKNGSDVINCF
jgi:alpha-glucosidase (family GH31 glycosyl hydrolase)